MLQILCSSLRVKLLARAKLIFLREQSDYYFFLWGALGNSGVRGDSGIVGMMGFVMGFVVMTGFVVMMRFVMMVGVIVGSWRWWGLW